MRVFIGLGNPGFGYRRTRHNVGYRVIDAWAERLQLRLKPERDGLEAASGVIGSEAIVLIKPATFMNRSGRAVVEATQRYGVGLADLVVVCDDVHLPLGTLRLRGRGSAGGHNGLASIIEEVGSEAFARQRLGISRPPDGVDLVDYVLGTLTAEEEAHLQPVIDRACEQLRAFVVEGLVAAMSRYNG